MSDERMSNGNEIQQQIDRALHTLTAAPHPEGLEVRIAGRLRQRNFATKREWWRHSAAAGWSAAVAMVLLVLSFALFHRHATKTLQAIVPAPAVHQPETAAATQPERRSVAPARAHLVHTRKQTFAPASKLIATRGFQNPPVLPMTQQEELLLALAQQPQLLPQLKSIVRTENMPTHGLGHNSISELSTHPLQPLQPAPLGDFQ